MRTLALAAAIVGCLAMSGCAGMNDLARSDSRMDNDLDASKVLTVNEWAGLWQNGERYHAGEKVLLFLYRHLINPIRNNDDF